MRVSCKLSPRNGHARLGPCFNSNQLTNHCVLDNAWGEAVKLEPNLVSERKVQRGRLKAERFEIERAAAAIDGNAFELVDELRTDATAAVLGIHPELLKLAAHTPAATHGPANHFIGSHACEA